MANLGQLLNLKRKPFQRNIADIAKKYRDEWNNDGQPSIGAPWHWLKEKPFYVVMAINVKIEWWMYF